MKKARKKLASKLREQPKVPWLLLEQHPDVFIVVHSALRHTQHASAIGDLLGELGTLYLIGADH